MLGTATKSVRVFALPNAGKCSEGRVGSARAGINQHMLIVDRHFGSAADRHCWDDHRVALPRLGLDEGVEFVDGDAGACHGEVDLRVEHVPRRLHRGSARRLQHGAPPDDDVFVFITELMRSAGTYLYGRRMYETMAVWETDATLASQTDLMADYASAWQAARTRSSTPRPWPQHAPRTLGSNATSTPAPYAT